MTDAPESITCVHLTDAMRRNCPRCNPSHMTPPADIAHPMTVAEAAKVADLRFQDIGGGFRPPMPVDALIRDLEGYSKCMPSAHRAQNVMAQAAKLIRAMSQGGE